MHIHVDVNRMLHKLDAHLRETTKLSHSILHASPLMTFADA